MTYLYANKLCIITEFISGGDLDNHIKNKIKRRKKL